MLLALAPMKDVTDLAFLNTLKDLNSLPDYFITEYFRTVAHHKKMSPYILRSIDENPTGRPIYGQLVGHEPEYLARDAQVLMEHACAGVDLNMGCPAPKITGSGAGSALPYNAAKSASDMRSRTGIAYASGECSASAKLPSSSTVTSPLTSPADAATIILCVPLAVNQPPRFAE